MSTPIMNGALTDPHPYVLRLVAAVAAEPLTPYIDCSL